MGKVADGMSTALVSLDQLTAEARKLLGHDLRYAIFMKLGERPRSATELGADPDIEADVKEISRQIRTLGKAGLVELAATPAGPKGGLLHRYVAVRHVFSAEEWDDLPEDGRADLSVRISRTLIREISEALDTGSFDSHPNRVLGRRPIELDDEGAEKVDEIMTRADEEIAQASAESLARGKQTRAWTAAVLAFPAPE